MHERSRVFQAAVLVLNAGPLLLSTAAETFRVASYNLEGYLDMPTETRPAKSKESKAKIRESILAIKPDVLALQEMGTTNALLELRDSLKTQGFEFPYWEHVSGFDTNIHVAVLSRFPFTSRRPYTNENFLLSGRRFRVSRGFAEMEIQVSAGYSFTLLTAHLKSKRPVASADEAEMRLAEAKLLREKIDARLNADPQAHILVLGDFNDTKDSASTRAVIGRYRGKLIDTRPAEQNGDEPPGDGRNVTWTHYYAKTDSYERIDFLLLSQAMARGWRTNDTCVLSIPGWGTASDHRPIYATFDTVGQ